jgi:hypothetical protein
MQRIKSAKNNDIPFFVGDGPAHYAAINHEAASDFEAMTLNAHLIYLRDL